MSLQPKESRRYLFDADDEAETLTSDRAQGVEYLLHRNRMDDASKIGSKRNLVHGFHLDFTPDLNFVTDFALTKIQNER
jgi:hypothetical protein